MKSFDDIIASYGLTKARPEFYAACLEAPEKYCEPGFFRKYLTAEYLHDLDRRYLDLPGEALQALLEAAELIRRETELCRLAGCAWWLLFASEHGVDELAAMGFPRPSGCEPLINDLFGLHVHLAGMGVVEERYRARKIPLEYMKASYRSVRIWLEAFRGYYGRWGHNRECPRMVFIENFRFIRIGRLEYEMGYLYAQVHLFRSHKDGKVVIGSAGGIRVNSAGHVVGTNDEILPVVQETVWEEDENSYLVNLVDSPNCAFQSQPVRLLKSEWAHFACTGSRCIGMHIPRDGRLHEDDARSSLREAVHFFRTYFPEWKFELFQCHSWLLDPIYRKLLGEQSNIVRFQKIFRCLPEKSTDHGAMVFAFTEAPFEMKDWVPVSTLQRLLKERYLRGEKVAAAAGIIPLEDLNL